MDENLPENWDKFFENGGTLPEGMTADASVETPAEVVPEVKTAVVDPAVPEVKVEVPAAPDMSKYEQMLANIQQQNDLLKQQLDAVKASIPKAPEPQAPDPATDPLGNLDFQLKAIQKQITDMQSGTETRAAQTDQQTNMQRFTDTVNAQVNTFKAGHADYDAAYNHLVQTRVADYMDRGMTQTQARQEVGKEEMTIAMDSLKNGKNPAEVAYNMAKRYGYAAKAVVETPENKIEKIKKGLEATKEVEAEAGSEKPTLANLREADEKQLDRMVRDDWDAIFGKKSSVV